MIDAVFRFADLETFVSKMADLGVDTRPAVDEEGNTYRIEERVGTCMTPPLTAANGNLACCVRLTKEQAALIPDVTAPDFLCDWRNDETEEVEIEGELVEQLLPWPEYEVNDYDKDGNVTGTRMQGCGRIG